MRCAEDQFGHRDKRELGALAEDRVKNRFFASCCVRGGPSANAAAFHIIFSSAISC